MHSDNHNYSYDNLEESEMGQLHAMHLSLNAVAGVRAKLAKQAMQPSLIECVECDEEIPEARRLAIPGVQMCVHCKQASEQK